MSKAKQTVAVYSSRGQSFTTRSGARRMLKRELAREREDGALEMIESDPRFQSAANAIFGDGRLRSSWPPVEKALQKFGPGRLRQ